MSAIEAPVTVPLLRRAYAALVGIRRATSHPIETIQTALGDGDVRIERSAAARFAGS
jgi:hypothetical protein